MNYTKVENDLLKCGEMNYGEMEILNMGNDLCKMKMGNENAK